MATKAQHDAAYEAVPPLLRAFREAAGLTQRGLGKLLGKPQSWIHNCEVARLCLVNHKSVSWPLIGHETTRTN